MIVGKPDILLDAIQHLEECAGAIQNPRIQVRLGA
jgi:hypothetical protein